MYTVTLEGYSESSLPERARREAEDRFRRTLERSLGGPEAVTAAYKAWQNAEETSESEFAAEAAINLFSDEENMPRSFRDQLFDLLSVKAVRQEPEADDAIKDEKTDDDAAKRKMLRPKKPGKKTL